MCFIGLPPLCVRFYRLAFGICCVYLDSTAPRIPPDLSPTSEEAIVARLFFSLVGRFFLFVSLLSLLYCFPLLISVLAPLLSRYLALLLSDLAL